MPVWGWGGPGQAFPLCWKSAPHSLAQRAAEGRKPKSGWEGWKWFHWVVSCVPKSWSRWSVFSAKGQFLLPVQST